jgi:6-hydroxycyclohex-1-ene-1-carbonyl-CoA dehydrogenase
MRAAIFKGPNMALSLEDVQTPDIGQDEVLVKVVACGTCHTDLHYLDHGVPTFKPPPLILGHEASGILEQVGSDVKGFVKGDRVVICAVTACGSCAFCAEGRANICQNMQMFGNHIDGAFAEFVRAPSSAIVRVPESIRLEDACIIADAISTPYYAVVHRARVKRGDRVAVFGCGGVGMNAVQISVALGAEVIAVDIDQRKLEIASSLGAQTILAQPDVVKRIKSITKGGVNIAFECIGNPQVVVQAYDSLKRGGYLCVVGYCTKPVELNLGKLMFFELGVIGSLGCPPQIYPEVIQMVEEKRIQLEPLITGRFRLEEINQAFDVLRSGKGLRNIIVFS